jgi:hypothetical protein
MDRVIGNSNAQLPLVSAQSPGPPHTYFGIARGFANAIDPLVAAGPSCSLPLTFLCAQITENALKAALSKNGDDSMVRTPAIQHNLAGLWAFAEAQGIALTKVPPGWLLSLSDLHKAPYHLRYSTNVNGLVLPVQTAMVEGVRQLLLHLEQFISK